MAANYTKYNDDVVMNQSWHYSNCCDVWEVRPDLVEILEIFYSFTIRTKIIHSQNTKSSQSSIIRLFKEIMLSKITEPLKIEFMDEIMFLVFVFKQLFFILIS